MSGPIVLAVVASLLSGAPAKKVRASTWVDEMNAGQQAHGTMDLDGALKRFRKALSLTSSAPEKVEAYLWIGLTQCELGVFKECESAFNEALELDDNAALPVDVPPRTTGIFEATKLKRAPPPLPPD